MSTPRPSVRSGTRTTPPPRTVSAPTRPAAAAPEKRSAVKPRTFMRPRPSVLSRENRRQAVHDLAPGFLLIGRRVELREFEGRVQGDAARFQHLSRDLPVEEEVAEAVHAHGDGHGLRAVEKLGDAGAQRRALLGRAGGKVEQPAVRDGLLHLSDALEVDRPLHLLPALAEAAAKRYAAGFREELSQGGLLHRLRRLHEVRLVVREEHDVLPRELVDDRVADDPDAVQEPEIGDRETELEARDDSAAKPAVEERLPERSQSGRILGRSRGQRRAACSIPQTTISVDFGAWPRRRTIAAIWPRWYVWWFTTCRTTTQKGAVFSSPFRFFQMNGPARRSGV